ncbi:hypothetical protein MBAV_002652 [Candidatus Magnetobacterium bavaricum]|uniref:Uncharacterized protein n=1 Tax=Candidatus Magnetobacterium bavaricum TaxID=29290 RepID=A0A0F3GT83_9BACT|nr:hypothetical protein MBAV_002652 [Candidatus Magnetobacterium bavaricum]
MSDSFTPLSNDPVENALLSLAIEGWRFSRAYLRLISKIEVSEQNRFFSQCRYFQKQIEEKVGEIGYKLVNIEGHPFEPGIAATALNIADFMPDDNLVVEQMLEPVITNENGIVKMGTVLLRKGE